MARRAVMRLAALLVLLSSAPAQDLFSEADELLAAGRPRAALELAAASADALLRAQARLYVLHHGGDLAGALSAGLDGLRAAPENPWLIERCTTLAVDLGATELAVELAARLESLADSPEGERWAERAAELRSEVEGRLDQRARSERSLARAKLTVLAAGIATLAGLGLTFVRMRARAAQPH